MMNNNNEKMRTMIWDLTTDINKKIESLKAIQNDNNYYDIEDTIKSLKNTLSSLDNLELFYIEYENIVKA